MSNVSTQRCSPSYFPTCYHVITKMIHFVVLTAVKERSNISETELTKISSLSETLKRKKLIEIGFYSALSSSFIKETVCIKEDSFYLHIVKNLILLIDDDELKFKTLQRHL